MTGAGFLSQAMMLFNRLIWGLLPQMSRNPNNVDNDGLHYEATEKHHIKNDKDKDTQNYPSSFITEATVAVQQEDGLP